MCTKHTNNFHSDLGERIRRMQKQFTDTCDSVGSSFVSSSPKMMAPAETFLICVSEIPSSNRDRSPTGIFPNNISHQVSSDFVHIFQFTTGDHSTTNLFITRYPCSYSQAINVRVQSQAKLCGIYGRPSGTERGFTASNTAVSIISPTFYTYSFTY
jgi:hypothetical protein